jgi:hypothetical protein
MIIVFVQTGKKNYLWILDMVNDIALLKNKFFKLNKVLVNCCNVNKIQKWIFMPNDC